ncbi:MAG: cyclophilin-like fold protein [Candidatus Thorarchaeota archaeon]
MTESDINITLDFEGDISIRAILDRVLAPLIVEDIQGRLPIHERSAVLRGEMKITLGLKKGTLKPTKSVKRGDIAYMPLGDSLCIYLKDTSTFSPVNIIGRIISDDSKIDLLGNVRRGGQVTIRPS